jgi:hypothetical protein
MRIQSGYIKATKKDIEDIKVFLAHAETDMEYGWEGSYGGYTEDNAKEKKKAEREFEAGKRGMEYIRFILEGLCEGWK